MEFGFLQAGTVPNRFFTAQDMPVITWVLTLGRSMMKSASRTGRSRLNSFTRTPSVLRGAASHAV